MAARYRLEHIMLRHSDVLEEEKWSIGTPRAELVKEAVSYLLDKAAEPAFDSFSKDTPSLSLTSQFI